MPVTARPMSAVVLPCLHSSSTSIFQGDECRSSQHSSRLLSIRGCDDQDWLSGSCILPKYEEQPEDLLPRHALLVLGSRFVEPESCHIAGYSPVAKVMLAVILYL